MAGTVCIRLPINKDESLFGYLARVAEANGYDRSTWLLPIGQTTWFDTSKWNSDTIKHVARITGLAPYEVAVRLYADIGNDKVTFFGDRIRSILIDQRGQKAARKFCPDCLCETGFHSTLFDLVPIQVCPQHACRLTDTCPHCNKKVFWGQPSLVTCLACGGDLRAFKTEKIPVGELRGLTAVAKRFGYPHQHPHLAKQNPALADELAHLSTGEILELVITLAGYLGRRSNDCASFLTFTPEMRTNAHLVLNTRLPFVQRWPEGLFEFLDLYSLARGQTTQRANGLVKSFGRFYLSLIGQTEEPWLTVKAAFADFIENHWTGVSIPRSKLPDKKSAGNGRITIVETCRILGLPPPKVHDLIKPSTDSVNPKERWRGTPIFAGPQDIEKIASNGEKPLLLAELCQALGLNQHRQRQFLKGNVITPVLGPTIDGSPFYLFNAAQSNDILDDFTKWLTERPSGGSLPCTFDDVLKSQSLRQIPVKMVIDAIRSGRLAPIGKSDDKRGLFAFLFDLKTATRILSELQIEHSVATRAFSSEADTGSREENAIKQEVTDVSRFHGIGERSSSNMTIASTAMHLRICHTAVCGMLDAGFLEIALQAPRAKRITIESIEAFKQRYIKTSVLVEEHGTKAQFITERLKAIGIEKASISSGGRAYTSFYEREKLRGVDFKTLLKKIPKRTPRLMHAHPPGMSADSTAIQLHVRYGAIRELVDAGFLETIQSKRKWHITTKSIEAFQQRYIRTSTLIDEHGTNARFIIKRLKSIGIERASNSSGKVTNASFYEREKLRGIDFKTLLKKAQHRERRRVKQPPSPTRISGAADAHNEAVLHSASRTGLA